MSILLAFSCDLRITLDIFSFWCEPGVGNRATAAGRSSCLVEHLMSFSAALHYNCLPQRGQGDDAAWYRLSSSPFPSTFSYHSRQDPAKSLDNTSAAPYSLGDPYLAHTARLERLDNPPFFLCQSRSRNLCSPQYKRGHARPQYNAITY